MLFADRDSSARLLLSPGRGDSPRRTRLLPLLSFLLRSLTSAFPRGGSATLIYICTAARFRCPPTVRGLFRLPKLLYRVVRRVMLSFYVTTSVPSMYGPSACSRVCQRLCYSPLRQVWSASGGYHLFLYVSRQVFRVAFLHS